MRDEFVAAHLLGRNLNGSENGKGGERHLKVVLLDVLTRGTH